MNENQIHRCAVLVAEQIEVELKSRTGFLGWWKTIRSERQQELSGEIAFIAEAVIGGAMRSAARKKPTN